jgi:hypothetical protein
MEAIIRGPLRPFFINNIEVLLENLGAKISEGNGSQVRIALNGMRAVFHKLL